MWLAGCGCVPQPTPVLTPSIPTSAPEPTTTAVAAPTVGGRTATFVIVPGETSASYSIEEILLNENNRVATVIGKTTQVEGEFVLNYEDPSASQFGLITANLRGLISDERQRDEAIRAQWLESARYPLATFRTKEVRNFPAEPRAGEPVHFQLVGDLTIKEVSREVTWDVAATLKVDQLVGPATTSILLADFNVPPPGVAGVLIVADGVTVSVDFTFKTVRSTPAIYHG